MTYDAIVVGAGHNGLAAAVHLSARGWKVLVLERQPQPGGAVKTAECTLPGFRHDLYAMNLSLFAGSAFHAEHGARLAGHGLAFVGADKPFASAFPEGSSVPWLGVEQGLDATLAHVARADPQDAERWRALNARFDREAPHLFALLGTPLPSWPAAKNLVRLVRGLGLGGATDLAQLLVSSPRAFLQREFRSEAVQCLLAAWGLHLDYAPDVAGGALFPYLEAMAGQRFGMALGQGGADVIVRAMVAAIRAAGGEVRCDADVRRIEVGGGRATGVELASGERLAARRGVIANVHPAALYGPLLGAAAPADAERARRLRPGPATMMIHLALDALPRWRAGPELQRFAYVHLAPSLAQMAQTYADALAGRLPGEPVVVVGQPTVFDASRAPAGRHVLWVQVRTLPFQVRGDALGQIAPGPWDELKEIYAERVLDLLECYAPGLRGSVLGRHVLSPVDLARDNVNLVGGDSLSGSHHLDQFLLFRPARGRSRWRTGVAGLYHVGASTWPGAGTGAGSGYMLARELAP
jgi:phytoene dehydrogenase-like protein